jgi:hypothetical protein
MAEIALKLHLEALDERGYIASSSDLPGVAAPTRSEFHGREIISAGLLILIYGDA